ncbi:hypothetical protein LTR82_018139 [Friedmanniomyces endolithicus]|uniref:Uncharacterized protein n=1 Tax=Friedmanniomyces endolithicus TaxID=329885 RepID=A0AAN6IYW0_9PEZI|nr:hypothetical protein LTR82_018139 [Friedmanniomyces endolithicus]
MRPRPSSGGYAKHILLVNVRRRTAPQTSSAKSEMTVTGRSVKFAGDHCRLESDEGSDTDMLNPGDPEMHDSVTGPIRSHDSSGGEAHGAEFLLENVKNPQPPVCSQPKERLALPEHDGSFETQKEARTMEPERSSGERSILREQPKPISQDPVGEDPVAYEEAYPEPVGREVGHSLVGQERTDTGSRYVNIVDHALRDPEQTDGTGIERTPDNELTSDPLSPRMASTSEAGEHIRAIAKVPTDDDPDQSRRKTDGVPRGITIAEHDPVMPNKQSTTQSTRTAWIMRMCQTSTQASLLGTMWQTKLTWCILPLENRGRAPPTLLLRLSSHLWEKCRTRTGLIRLQHMRIICRTILPASRYLRHQDPSRVAGVTVAAPAQSYPAPLFALQPAMTATLEPLETPSPSAEPYQTASIAYRASTSPITQPVGATVALIDITYTESFQCRSACVFVVVCGRSSGVSAGSVTTAGITPAPNAYHRLSQKTYLCLPHVQSWRLPRTPPHRS